MKDSRLLNSRRFHELGFLEIPGLYTFCLMASSNCPKCACFAFICLHNRTSFVPIAVLVVHLSAVGTDGEAIESVSRASGCRLNAFYCGDLRAVSAPPVHAMQ